MKTRQTSRTRISTGFGTLAAMIVVSAGLTDAPRTQAQNDAEQRGDAVKESLASRSLRVLLERERDRERYLQQLHQESYDPNRNTEPVSWTRIVERRWPADDEPMLIDFDGVSLLEFIPIIEASTGKRVIVDPDAIRPVRITLRPAGAQARTPFRNEFLDQIYDAVTVPGVVLIEDEDSVWIGLHGNRAEAPSPPLLSTTGDDFDRISCNGATVDVTIPIAGRDEGDLSEQAELLLGPTADVWVETEPDRLRVRGRIGGLKRLLRWIGAEDHAFDGAGVPGPGEPPHGPGDVFRIPTSGGGFRPPYRGREIAAMRRDDALGALADIARVSGWRSLDEALAAQLKREFDAIVERIRRLDVVEAESRDAS